ncbi:antibiotic biosynthesis monooxygenase [uncultured Meiothermus sp.]|uniref:antibiotic biosynthesis monooxygenase family protein n=1 Tax=uncultured Meiothermus sp. TaxID=157471 RepID=UPI00263A2171|nr:antibiotic biosynthesis monooxygenase [uncultured Meiothermus sp.]
MFVTMNRIAVNPEHAGLFEQSFIERTRLVDTMPGFIRNQVLRPANPAEQPYIVMTFWESEASFAGWVESPQFKEGHARSTSLPREAFREHSRLETYQVFADSVDQVPLEIEPRG